MMGYKIAGNICLIATIILICSISGCSKGGKEAHQEKLGSGKHLIKESKTEAKPFEQKIEIMKVTFVEVGSVRCIPCRMMQPIMKEIEEEYKDQVKIIFYDVWTSEGKPHAQEYGIRVIPTQVFLDKDGNEYFRHEGFFPKEELIRVLKQQGVE